jgi:hypothetical protein
MTQRYQQNPAAETAPMGAGLVVLEPKDRKFCALNATSSLIWARLKEPASLEQLAKHIVDNFQGVKEQEALKDAAAIVEEMTSLAIVIPVR